MSSAGCRGSRNRRAEFEAWGLEFFMRSGSRILHYLGGKKARGARLFGCLVIGRSAAG